MRIGVCRSHEKPAAKLGYLNRLLNPWISDSGDWSPKFKEALEKYGIPYGEVNMDRNDWITGTEKFDVLIWKPRFMGPHSSQFFKEKVFFCQHILNKRIFPNYETVWHFDSKIAQKYMLEYMDLNTPETFVGFDFNECVNTAETCKLPVVWKSSNGAGSTRVKLIRSRRSLIRHIEGRFLWPKIANKFLGASCDSFGYAYWQRFIEGNSSDLRINVFGNKYATGFWRLNRDNDFRASGSGKIDYSKAIPHDIIEYCVNINRLNRFDSMAYDIIFDSGVFVIVEMSYGFVDKAVYGSHGYYEIGQDGKISSFHKGNIWPQELWVKCLIEEVYNDDERTGMGSDK